MVDTQSKEWKFANDRDVSKRRPAQNWSVDNIGGRGWYGYNADGPTGRRRHPIASEIRKIIMPGSSPAPLKNAVLRDWPGFYIPNLSWSFETAAIAKRGRDAGKVYGVIEWGFEVDDKNHIDPHPARLKNVLGPRWQEAVEAWNEQATGPEAKRAAADQRPLRRFRLSP